MTIVKVIIGWGCACWSKMRISAHSQWWWTNPLLKSYTPHSFTKSSLNLWIYCAQTAASLHRIFTGCMTTDLCLCPLTKLLTVRTFPIMLSQVYISEENNEFLLLRFLIIIVHYLLLSAQTAWAELFLSSCEKNQRHWEAFSGTALVFPS